MANTTSIDLRAGKLKYLERMAKDDPNAVPLEDAVFDLRDEVAFICARLDAQAEAEKIAWPYAKARQKRLRTAVARLSHLLQAEQAAKGIAPVQQHEDDGTEIEL